MEGYDYETKLLEREQDAEEKGLKRGIEKGIQQGIEQGILQGKKEGKEKERITGIKKLIGALKDFGGTDHQILERLEQDYGDSFSKEQLEEFLREG
nr:hypothetical protein [Lactobacillus gasseri]